MSSVTHNLPPLSMTTTPQLLGIVNYAIKCQTSCSMEMRYFWLLDGKQHNLFTFHHHPWAENLADYPTKAHNSPQHQLMRPMYTHMVNSPLCVKCATTPNAPRGCVVTTGHMYAQSIHKVAKPYLHTLGYQHNIPLVALVQQHNGNHLEPFWYRVLSHVYKAHHSSLWLARPNHIWTNMLSLHSHDMIVN